MAERLGVPTPSACRRAPTRCCAALMALGVGPGDEVITPTYSFFATAGCVWRLGARPVFVDIDPATLQPDRPTPSRAAMTPRTKAIIPVHLFGQMAEMAPLLAVAARHGRGRDRGRLPGDRRGRRRGAAPATVGAIGCFSFFPSKNLGGFGDGGLVTTNDDALAAPLRLLRGHGARDEVPPRDRRRQLPPRRAAGGGAAASSCRTSTGWTRRAGGNAARYRALFAEAAARPACRSRPDRRADAGRGAGRCPSSGRGVDTSTTSS